MSAIVTSLISIVLVLLGLFISGYANDPVGNYIFISGIIMLPLGICFTIGLFKLKKQNDNGRKWIIGALSALIFILILSAIIISLVASGWKIIAITLILTSIINAPFIWLISYLWAFAKNDVNPS